MNKYTVRFKFHTWNYTDIVRSVTRIPLIGEHVTFQPTDVDQFSHRTFKVMRVECEYDFLDGSERFTITIS